MGQGKVGDSSSVVVEMCILKFKGRTSRGNRWVECPSQKKSSRPQFSVFQIERVFNAGHTLVAMLASLLIFFRTQLVSCSMEERQLKC